MMDSYFDGGLFEFVLYRIVGILITTLTLGIAYPWALCLVYRWETEHTVIQGRRLGFNGSAMSLFAHWIKWLLLTIITFGIYSFWLRIALTKWKTKHTYFQN